MSDQIDTVLLLLYQVCYILFITLYIQYHVHSANLDCINGMHPNNWFTSLALRDAYLQVSAISHFSTI